MPHRRQIHFPPELRDVAPAQAQQAVPSTAQLAESLPSSVFLEPGVIGVGPTVTGGEARAWEVALASTRPAP
jgi:hypothetical protein